MPLAICTIAAAVCLTAAASAPWKIVAYWPRVPADYGCVGIVYQNASLAGYYTRSKIVRPDGSLLVSPRHPDPAAAPGRPTIRAAIDGEKALHWHGCW